MRVPGLACVIALVTACGTAPQVVHTKDQAEVPVPASMQPYEGAASRIVDRVLARGGAWSKLLGLCDGFGHRLTGSQALEGAIDWALARMKAEGADVVRREEVEVQRWVRGAEAAALVTPRVAPIFLLGLGDSVGTPPGGITAEVVTVHTEEEFAALDAEAVRGRIVLYNNPMPRWTEEEGTCYGKTVRFRLFGAKLAAAKGALAVLVRSVTATSLRSPHTGVLLYGDAPTKIPAAAVSTEDADIIERLQTAGHTVTVKLEMGAHFAPPGVSANAVAELRGRELPDEIVLVSGHIDSWDVGQGAHDDGAGVVMAMEALAVLAELGLRPRRTLRVVLWTNEENGMAGAKSYLKRHAAELPKHQVALEADFGGFAPDGFGVKMEDEAAQARAAQTLRDITTLLQRVGTLTVKPGSAAPDVGHFVKEGVAAMGFYTHGERYFDYHHTEADTVDKVDPSELARSAAAMAVAAYVLAEMPGRLGR